METKISIIPSGNVDEHQIKILVTKNGKKRVAWLNVFKHHTDSFLKEYMEEQINILELSIDAGVAYCGASGINIKKNQPEDYIEIIRKHCKIVE